MAEGTRASGQTAGSAHCFWAETRQGHSRPMFSSLTRCLCHELQVEGDGTKEGGWDAQESRSGPGSDSPGPRLLINGDKTGKPLCSIRQSCQLGFQLTQAAGRAMSAEHGALSPPVVLLLRKPPCAPREGAILPHSRLPCSLCRPARVNAPSRQQL